jgi:peptidoglycan/xylan/chitin deacetylase (PgdA/CDA1 family)
MNDLAIYRAASAAPRPSARFAHALRNVAPRAASLLPGVISRSVARDSAGRRLLYVTIDDGPDAAGTPLLLEALSTQSAQATFFLLASRAATDVGLVRAIVGAGHRVGNHGWEHLDGWRRPGTVANLERGEAWLEDALGYAVRDVRPPYGHVTPAVLRWAGHGGRRVVLWDTMPGDFGFASTVDLAGHLLSRVRPGSISVLHDGRPAARAAATLQSALPRLREAGWRFPAL